MTNEERKLRESLAEYAYEAWSGWMKHLFGKSTQHPITGETHIPLWAMDRWKRLAGTKYADLTEQEKNSDRVEAERMMGICKLFFAGSNDQRYHDYLRAVLTGLVAVDVAGELDAHSTAMCAIAQADAMMGATEQGKPAEKPATVFFASTPVQCSKTQEQEFLRARADKDAEIKFSPEDQELDRLRRVGGPLCPRPADKTKPLQKVQSASGRPSDKDADPISEMAHLREIYNTQLAGKDAEIARFREDYDRQGLANDKALEALRGVAQEGNLQVYALVADAIELLEAEREEGA